MARSRILYNNNGTAWVVSQLGGISVGAGSPGQLDITPYFTDEELRRALQNGLAATLSVSKYLVVDGSTINSAATALPFYDTVAPLILDLTDAGHAHDDAGGGAVLTGYPQLDGTEAITGDWDFDAAHPPTIGAVEISTKAYVDSVAQGLDVKEAVKWATEAVLPAYSQSGTGVGAFLRADSNGNLTIDGHSPAVGERILVKNEVSGTAKWNGIYTLTVLGDVDTRWKMVRATDFDGSATGTVSSGAFVFVTDGDFNSGAGYVLTTPDTITIDSTALSFTQFSGAGEITAGVGLRKDGNTLEIGTHNANDVVNGIQFLADDIQVDLQAGGGLEFGGTGNDEGIKIKPDSTTGVTVAPLSLTSYGAGVQVDDATLEHTTGSLHIKNGGVDTDQLAEDAVTADKIDADVAGTGLAQALGGALDVDLGDGLEFGTNGDANKIQVAPDDSDSAVIAPVSVTSDGVGVTIDNDTIVHNSGELSVVRAPLAGQTREYIFGKTGNIPMDSFLQTATGVYSNVAGYLTLHAAHITGMSIQMGTAGVNAGQTFTFQCYAAGTIIAGAELELDSGDTWGTVIDLNEAILAGTQLQVFVVTSAGVPSVLPADAVVIVEITFDTAVS